MLRLHSCRSLLDSCGILRISGRDASKFLNGLCTNNMTEDVGYTGFLNPKGRYMFDSLIHKSTNSEEEVTYMMQVQKSALPFLERHTKRFRLRSKATIEDVSSEFQIWSIMSTDSSILKDVKSMQDSLCIAQWDPRCKDLGLRVITPCGHEPLVPDGSSFEVVKEDVWDLLRTLYGVPLGGKEMLYEKTLPLEANMSFLNGVSFDKGCYLGQELTARTQFQGLIRKRIVPVYFKPMSSANVESEATTFFSNSHPASEGCGLFDRFSFITQPYFHPDSLIAGADGQDSYTTPTEFFLDITLMDAENTKANKRTRAAGKLLSISPLANVGMAMLRLEHIKEEDSRLQVEVDGQGFEVIPIIPEWLTEEIA